MSFLGRMLAGSTSPTSVRVDADDAGFLRSIPQSSHAGIAVTEHAMFQMIAVYSAIGIISENKAQLPIDVLRRDGKRKVSESGHPLAHVLNNSLNRYMTAFTGRSTLQAHVLSWGNCFGEIVRNGNGEVVEIWPLLPDRTDIVPDGDRLAVQTTIEGKPHLLGLDRVLHIPAMGFDGIKGYSPIRHVARNAIGLGLALEEFGSKFIANDAKSGGFVEHPGTLGEEGTQNLSEFVNDQGGLENAHRIKVLEEGAKFHPTTIPPEDAQFLLTRQFQIEEIARLYRVALHMLQSHGKDTAWGSGIAQMSLGFLLYTLATWLVRWEQEMNRKLFTDAERRQGFYVRHNVGGLLRGDAKSRAEYYKLAIESGWLTIDEVRELEDRDPMTRERVDMTTLQG